MPTPTYIPLATLTLTATDSELIFSSIPATYRDIVLVITSTTTGQIGQTQLRFNSDSTNHYANIEAGGGGSGSGFSGAYTETNAIIGYQLTTAQSIIIANIMDYRSTDKHKTVIARQSIPGEVVKMSAHRWPSNNAINTISVKTQASTWAIGSTFSLYGIA